MVYNNTDMIAQDCTAIFSTECSGKVAKMMCEVGQVLASQGIIWWVQYGTLLGVIRDGTFLEHDDDQDVGVMVYDYTQYLTPNSPLPNPVAERLHLLEYRIHDWGKISPSTGGTACGAIIDTWPMCINGTDGKMPEDRLYYCDCPEMNYDSKHFVTQTMGASYANLAKIGVGGVWLPVPIESHSLLEGMYGDWTTPGSTRANDGHY